MHETYMTILARIGAVTCLSAGCALAYSYRHALVEFVQQTLHNLRGNKDETEENERDHDEDGEDTTAHQGMCTRVHGHIVSHTTTGYDVTEIMHTILRSMYALMLDYSRGADDGSRASPAPVMYSKSGEVIDSEPERDTYNNERGEEEEDRYRTGVATEGISTTSSSHSSPSSDAYTGGQSSTLEGDGDARGSDRSIPSALGMDSTTVTSNSNNDIASESVDSSANSNAIRCGATHEANDPHAMYL
jgi:hypothetical protein